MINFSNQFDFLTSFTKLLHLSLNITNIVILFWGSGIGRWVWPDIRAEMIAFSNQFYFLTFLNQHCMEMNLEQRKANQRLTNRVDSFATYAYSHQFHWTNVLAICVCYSKPTLKLIHNIMNITCVAFINNLSVFCRLLDLQGRHLRNRKIPVWI